jgi:arginase family enzyme
MRMKRARHLWMQGAQVFALGGDHGVTIPLVDALDAVGEPVPGASWAPDGGMCRR